jgi:hypothetical protein
VSTSPALATTITSDKKTGSSRPIGRRRVVQRPIGISTGEPMNVGVPTGIGESRRSRRGAGPPQRSDARPRPGAAAPLASPNISLSRSEAPSTTPAWS